MTDLGAFFLALGFVVGCVVVSYAWLGIAERASEARANDVAHTVEQIRYAIENASKTIAAAMRHRTRAGLGLIRAKAPPPAPPDPRIAEGVAAIERLGLSPEETDDLIGEYEAVAGLRTATRAQIEGYVARLNGLRIPLPGA